MGESAIIEEHCQTFQMRSSRCADYIYILHVLHGIGCMVSGFFSGCVGGVLGRRRSLPRSGARGLGGLVVRLGLPLATQPFQISLLCWGAVNEDVGSTMPLDVAVDIYVDAKH